jgi:hypothetical protein
MPSNQPISNSPGLVQLDPWPLTRERVSHIFDGLKEFGVDLEVWLTEAKPWILDRPWVPEEKWCKQFPSFKLAGNGSEPKTGLGPETPCEGVVI